MHVQHARSTKYISFLATRVHESTRFKGYNLSIIKRYFYNINFYYKWSFWKLISYFISNGKDNSKEW